MGRPTFSIEKVSDIIEKRRKRVMKLNIKIIVMLILSVSLIIFIDNDYFLYKTPIMKVTNINNKIESEEYSGEKHY